MVVTCRPCAIITGMTQVRTAAPSRCMVQAPHTPMPQPNLLPVSRRCSRTTHSSATPTGQSNSAGAPLTKNFTGIWAHSLVVQLAAPVVPAHPTLEYGSPLSRGRRPGGFGDTESIVGERHHI